MAKKRGYIPFQNAPRRPRGDGRKGVTSACSCRRSSAWNPHPLPHQESVGQRIAVVDQPRPIAADECIPFDLGNDCIEFTAFRFAKHTALEDRSDDRLIHERSIPGKLAATVELGNAPGGAGACWRSVDLTVGENAAVRL